MTYVDTNATYVHLAPGRTNTTLRPRLTELAVPPAGPYQTYTNYDGYTVLSQLDSSITGFAPLQLPLLIPQRLNTWVAIGYTDAYVSGPTENQPDIFFSWQLVTVDPTSKAVTLGPVRHQTLHRAGGSPATLGAIGNDGSFLLSDYLANAIGTASFSTDFSTLNFSFASPTLDPTKLVTSSAYGDIFVASRRKSSNDNHYNVAYVNKTMAVCAVKPGAYPTGALVSINPSTGSTYATFALGTIATPGAFPFISISLFNATHILLVYGAAGSSVVNFYLVPLDPTTGVFGTPVLYPNETSGTTATTGGYNNSRSSGGQDWSLSVPRAFTPSGYVDNNFLGHTTSASTNISNPETLGLTNGKLSYWPIVNFATDPNIGSPPAPVTPGASSGYFLFQYVGAPVPQANQPFYVLNANSTISSSDGWIWAGSDHAQVTTIINITWTGSGDFWTSLAQGDVHRYWNQTVDSFGVPLSFPDIFYGGGGTVDPAGTPLWCLPSSRGGFWVTAGQQQNTHATTTYTGAIFNSSYMFENGNLDYGSYPGCTWGYVLDHASIHNSDLSHGSFEQECFYYTEASWCNFTNSLMGNDGNFEAYASDFTSCDFTGARFSVPGNGATTVSYCDFTKAILRNVDMRHIHFSQCSFIGADMTGAIFDASTTFTGCLYDATTKWPAGFDPTTISGAVHAFADYSNQTLTGTNLSGVFLGHANFENAVLTNVNLGSGYVGWANFKGAQLLGSTFSNHSSSQPAVPWSDFTGATIDFGTAKQSSYNLPYGIVTVNWAHAIFKNVQFIFGGVAGGVTIPAGTPVEINGAYGCAPYCTFDGVKNPPGYPLCFINGNFSYSTFVGARLSDSATLPTTAISGSMGESLFAYCDFTNLQGGWGFEWCNFSGATFRGANLPMTCFTASNLSDVDFTGAIVTPAAFDITTAGNFYQSLIGRPGGIHAVPWSATEYDLKATYNPGTKLPNGVSSSMLILGITNIDGGWDFWGYDPAGVQTTSARSDFHNQTITPLDGAYRGRGQLYALMVYYGVCRDVVFSPSLYAFKNLIEGYATDLRNAQFTGTIWDSPSSSGFYMSNLGLPAPKGKQPRGVSPSIAHPPRSRQPAVNVAALPSSKAISSSVQQ